MKHTKEWKSYLGSLKERAENTEPKYAQDAKDAEETLDMIFDCEKAADSGDEYALFFLATYKVERGIDFAENVAFLENLANKNNTNALVALGFLYAVGVFNEFDKSKSALIDTADDANAAKANEYFQKAANLGNVKAMVQRAIQFSIEATSNDELTHEERLIVAREAEEWAEKAKTANEEGKCDCDWDYYLPLLEGRLSSMKESLLCEVRD